MDPVQMPQKTLMRAGLDADDYLRQTGELMAMPSDDERNKEFRPPGEGPGLGPEAAFVVLVVEDDAWTRKTVGRKLQAAGLEVILVPTAADALIVAQRSTFHVLVLDLHLPDNSASFHGISDGFAVLDWLRRQIGGFKFKIVVHTSQRTPEVVQKAQQHGVFAVCYKQRDLENLLQCVTQAIDSFKVSP